MRWSEAFIATLREDPKEAELISHKLMLRAGLIKRLGSGSYSYLPLGIKVIRNAEDIIRREMNALGAQEVLLPALQPLELWKKTGRDKLIGDVMIRFKDRHGKEVVLGPTHEEVITDLVASFIKSYRQLPVILYQIQTKFRDEPRPQFGVIRSKEFIMKDAYSFDKDEQGLELNYNRMRVAYNRIFSWCGLKFEDKSADSGFIGGSESSEFVANDIEVGHIFKLGTKYSESFNATFLDEAGKNRPIVMGCYGIGVNRIIAAAIEQNNDADGIIWPLALAPYAVTILPLNSEGLEFALNLHHELTEANIETLIDDRDESAGVKFKDADLIGIPIRLIIGKEQSRQNKAEVNIRRSRETIFVSKERCVEKIKDMLREVF